MRNGVSFEKSFCEIRVKRICVNQEVGVLIWNNIFGSFGSLPRQGLLRTIKETRLALAKFQGCYLLADHGLRTSDEEITFTTLPKIKSQSQIFRYSQSIFFLPHRPKISEFRVRGIRILKSVACWHWKRFMRGNFSIKLAD